MRTKNIQKGDSYRYAFGRINAAIEAEFYLEAITLSESIISDRLLSHITHASGRRLAVTTPLNTLVKKWRDLALTDATWKNEDLGAAVDEWRKSRNSCVHGAAKSAPGSPTVPPDAYQHAAKKSATDGKRLARAVCDWHRAQFAKPS